MSHSVQKAYTHTPTQYEVYETHTMPENTFSFTMLKPHPHYNELFENGFILIHFLNSKKEIINRIEKTVLMKIQKQAEMLLLQNAFLAWAIMLQVVSGH